MLKDLTYDELRNICSKNGELSMTIVNDTAFAKDHNHLKTILIVDSNDEAKCRISIHDDKTICVSIDSRHMSVRVDSKSSVKDILKALRRDDEFFSKFNRDLRMAFKQIVEIFLNHCRTSAQPEQAA